MKSNADRKWKMQNQVILTHMNPFRVSQMNQKSNYIVSILSLYNECEQHSTKFINKQVGHMQNFLKTELKNCAYDEAKIGKLKH